MLGSFDGISISTAGRGISRCGRWGLGELNSRRPDGLAKKSCAAGRHTREAVREPAVCRRKKAIDCFLRTRMDKLVLGRHLVMRRKRIAS